MISWNEKGEKEVAGRLATTVLGVKPLLYFHHENTGFFKENQLYGVEAGLLRMKVPASIDSEF